MPSEIVQPRVYVRTFVLLLLLLGATIAANFIPLGPFNVAAALMISLAKGALIILFFMEVRYSKPIVWLFAAAGFVWLVLLLIMIQSDYQTRSWSAQNWRGGTNGQEHIEFNNPGSAKP
jgi:cytochrome c oxidase subunit 4